MSDNGPGYISTRFARLCRSAGLRHLRIRRYTPRTNEKAERFIQTLLREWAYRRAYPSSHQRTEALPAWRYYYNWERGHGALHGRPPISRLAARNALVAVHLGRGAGPGDQPQVMKLTVAQSVIRDARHSRLARVGHRLADLVGRNASLLKEFVDLFETGEGASRRDARCLRRRECNGIPLWIDADPRDVKRAVTHDAVLPPVLGGCNRNADGRPLRGPAGMICGPTG